MRWVLLGKFGEAWKSCAAFVLAGGDAVAVFLEPRARSRPGWDEDAFRQGVRAWAWRHVAPAIAVIGIQYVLGPGHFETEWLLRCPACGMGPFLLPPRSGLGQALQPMTWTEERLAQCLAGQFDHHHPAPPPQPSPGWPGTGRSRQEAAHGGIPAEEERGYGPPAAGTDRDRPEVAGGRAGTRLLLAMGRVRYDAFGLAG